MLPFPTYNIPDSLTNETVTGTKRLIFLMNQSISGSQQELIGKITGALKMDFEKDAVLFSIVETDQARIKEMIKEGTELVISFGVDPGAIGLWIDLQGSGIRFLEKFTFILTIALPDLEKNANAKKMLWNDMQHFMEMKANENG